jgi:hypothetical protein
LFFVGPESHVFFLLVFFSASRSMSTRAVIDSIKNKPVWFEDPGAYPVIVVCSVAMVGAGSYICYKFTSSPDVRWDKNKRGSVVRWWGDDKAQMRIQK